MVQNEVPPYEELKRRLNIAESSIRAIRNGEVDAIIGKDQTLIVRLLQTEKRADHIKNILLAIRRVHQIIIREHDPAQLIQKVCSTLTETLGYRSASISLLDEAESSVIKTISSSSDQYELEIINVLLSNGCFIPCIKTAFCNRDWFEEEHPFYQCPHCPLMSFAPDRSVLPHPLRFKDKTYGIICVSVDASLSNDPEVIGLFTDVADDLAFALSKIREAEKLAKTQAELQSSHNENKHLQEELFHARKLESIGRLAGGVAHDYNNMMSVILGHTELAIDIISPDNPIFKHLDSIMDASKRITAITRQLLTFARKQTIRPEVIDLNRILENIISFLANLISKNIDIEWISKSGLWQIKMDSSQIEQLLINLCTNARDAIGDKKGIIAIQTDNVTIDEYFAKHAGLYAGDFVLLMVKDNGCGIDEDILDNIFEPFFTTKEVGKGTGLGLATVYGIVKQNNGFIDVQSKKDKGTTFKIYLPRYQESKL